MSRDINGELNAKAMYYIADARSMVLRRRFGWTKARADRFCKVDHFDDQPDVFHAALMDEGGFSYAEAVSVADIDFDFETDRAVYPDINEDDY